MRGRGGLLQVMIVGVIVMIAWLVAFYWIIFALQVKRWHDRDKAWPYVFVIFIPFVGWLWVLIECGFLDGTLGPNRFGPDPLGKMPL